MDYQINNGILLNLDNDINKYQQSALGILLRGRIDEWRKQTALRVATLREKITELQEKYLVIENNQVQFSDELDDKGQKIPKMKDGLLLVAFNQEVKELMEKPVTINI